MLRRISYAILSIYLLINFIPLYYINKQLKPYEQEVMEIVKQYCKSNQYFRPSQRMMYFHTLKDNAIGMCIILPFSFKIEIDPLFWISADSDQRTEVIYHEMAHCLLGKEHVDNPNNYMYYSLVDMPKEEVKKQFIKDLEKHCGK